MTQKLNLKPDDIWVACSITEFGPAGHDRHIIRKGGITTVCGATATEPEIWRQNKAKPRCKLCIEKYQKEHKAVRPRKRTAKKSTSPRQPKEDKVVPKTMTKQELLDLTESLDQITYTLIDEFESAEIKLNKTVGTTKVSAEWDPNEREWNLEFK